MLKITAIPIVFMFLASIIIIPMGMAYATYGDSPTFTTAPTTTNQTDTNMTMPTSTSTNQTDANMTMPTSTSTNQTDTNMTMPTSTSTNQTDTTPKPSTPLTPLKQFKSGISAKDVQCQSGFSLVLKVSDGSPACVHPSIVQILILRGWAAIQ